MNKKLKAFTLVELLVAMAIIGVLLGLTLYGIGAAQRNSRDVARKSVLQDINAGIQDFYTVNGAYPTHYAFSINGYLAMATTSAHTVFAAGVCADVDCQVVPLDGPATPAENIALVAGVITMTADSTDQNQTQYCFSNTPTDGYSLSVALEKGNPFSLGSSVVDPGCLP